MRGLHQMTVAEPRDLYDHAADVARHYRAFGSYGGKATTAVRALQRRAPMRSRQECDLAFHRALLLFDYCTELMESESGRYLARTSESADYDFSDLVPRVKPGFAEFGDRTIEWVLGWIWLYYHLM